MNYRRVMRIPSLRKAAAPLAGVVLVLAGCAAEPVLLTDPRDASRSAACVHVPARAAGVVA